MIKNLLFSKVPYQINRQLHLYLGIFLSPFLILFAISTIVMNHPSPRDPDNPKFAETTEVVSLSIPTLVTDNMKLAREKFAEAKSITNNAEAKKTANQAGRRANNKAASAITEHVLKELQLEGELFAFGPIRNNKKRITVMVPGRTTIATVDVVKKEVSIQYRKFNFIDTMSYLHRNPGPHKTKGPNWEGSKLWGWVADLTVYLTLFLTLSGIYLWWVLKAERKTGFILMGTGFLSFVLITYALLASP